MIESNKIKDYFKKNIFILISAMIGIFLVFQKEIFNPNDRLDTNTIIVDQGSYINWPEIGRFGLMFTKALLNLDLFNPYASSVLSILFIFISLFLFCYILYHNYNIKTYISVIGFLLFFIQPILQAQLYFTLQMAEILFSLTLLIIVTELSYKTCQKKYIYISWYLLSVILCVWLFASYQSFVIMFISFCIFNFIMDYKTNVEKNIIKENKYYILIIIKLISIFIISNIIYFIIIKNFFNESGYLYDQVLWSKISLDEAIKNIINHIVLVFTASNIYYSISFLISVILASISLIIYYVKLKYNKINFRIFLIISFIGLQILPFAITIFSANTPTERSQLTLPLVTAFNFIIFTYYIKLNKKVLYPILFIFFLTINYNIQIILRLQYTDDIRHIIDKNVANNISNLIAQKTTSQDYELILIGRLDYIDLKSNKSTAYGEFTGLSVFDLFTEAEPRYFHSSIRNYYFFNVLGHKFKACTDKEYYKVARQKVKNLPSYPNNDCVLIDGNRVIVKIGEDKFYDEDFKQ